MIGSTKGTYANNLCKQYEKSGKIVCMHNLLSLPKSAKPNCHKFLCSNLRQIVDTNIKRLSQSLIRNEDLFLQRNSLKPNQKHFSKILIEGVTLGFEFTRPMAKCLVTIWAYNVCFSICSSHFQFAQAKKRKQKLTLSG